MTTFDESTVEEAALAWLGDLGWQVAHGPEIAPDVPGAERTDYGDVVLEGRLRAALARLNPGLPAEALDDAFRKLIRPERATLDACNRALHRLLVDGVTVEHRVDNGAIRQESDDPAHRQSADGACRVSGFTESDVEDAALSWLESFGWAVAHGPDIAPDDILAAQRDTLLSRLISGEIRLKEDSQLTEVTR